MLLSLARKRRLNVLAAGYAVVAVFGLVAVIARWGFGVSGSSALAAGAIAAVPLVVALLGERITQVTFLVRGLNHSSEAPPPHSLTPRTRRLPPWPVMIWSMGK